MRQSQAGKHTHKRVLNQLPQFYFARRSISNCGLDWRDCTLRIAFFVLAQARREIMRFTVDFDDEPRRMTNKVRDKGSHRHLPTKSQFIYMMGLEIAPQHEAS